MHFFSTIDADDLRGDQFEKYFIIFQKFLSLDININVLEKE